MNNPYSCYVIFIRTAYCITSLMTSSAAACVLVRIWAETNVRWSVVETTKKGHSFAELDYHALGDVTDVPARVAHLVTHTVHVLNCALFGLSPESKAVHRTVHAVLYITLAQDLPCKPNIYDNFVYCVARSAPGCCTRCWPCRGKHLRTFEHLWRKEKERSIREKKTKQMKKKTKTCISALVHIHVAYSQAVDDYRQC